MNKPLANANNYIILSNKKDLLFSIQFASSNFPSYMNFVVQSTLQLFQKQLTSRMKLAQAIYSQYEYINNVEHKNHHMQVHPHASSPLEMVIVVVPHYYYIIDHHFLFIEVMLQILIHGDVNIHRSNFTRQMNLP